MGNAVTLVAKQDHIVWTVFGAFWAANAVLLVALFQSGDLPKRPVGLIVSRVGFALSPVWLLIRHRAQAWHDWQGGNRAVRVIEKTEATAPRQSIRRG